MLLTVATNRSLETSFGSFLSLLESDLEFLFVSSEKKDFVGRGVCVCLWNI